MAFCPNCGAQIDATMRFCPNCGSQINVVTPVAANLLNNYEVVLYSCGDCTKTLTRDLLEDLLGYTDAQSKQLVDNAPCEIAQNLNEQQAVYLAQVLTEYGVQVNVCNANGYVNLHQNLNASVFDNNGSILNTALNVLGTLSAINCVSTITRWNRFNNLNPLTYLFTPKYRRPPRPVTYARRRAPRVVARPVPPPPRPAPRPVAPPPRAAAPRPVAPAPRPAAPAPRPVGPAVRPATPAPAPRPAAPRPAGPMGGKGPAGGRGPGSGRPGGS